MARTRVRRPGPARARTAVVLALVAAAGAGACGGDDGLNGIDRRPPAQIKAAAVAALRSARGVRIVGTPRSGPGNGAFDLRMNAHASTGTLTQRGEPVGLVIVGGRVYMKGSPAFYASAIGSAAAARVGRRWIELPAAQTRAFAPFTLAGVTADANADAAAGATVTRARLDGAHAVLLTERDGSQLYVANTGKPYPLRAVSAGDTPVTTVFSDFDRPVSVTAPAGAVDLTALARGGDR